MMPLNLTSLAAEIAVASIVVGERQRPADDAAVARLTDDIRLHGLLQPIIVTRREGAPKLVAGHHRLLAVARLGWTSVSAIVLPASMDKDDWRMIEIRENLIRTGLTKDERDEHIRTLAEIIGRRGGAVPEWMRRSREHPEAAPAPEDHEAGTSETQVSQNAALEIGHVIPSVNLQSCQNGTIEEDAAAVAPAVFQSQQNASIESKRADGRGHRPQGLVSQIAEHTGLSKGTVRRALNPESAKPKPAPSPRVSDAADRAEETSRRNAKPPPPPPHPTAPFASWLELTEQTSSLTADAIFDACPVRQRPVLSQRCEAVRAILDKLDALIERPPVRRTAA